MIRSMKNTNSDASCLICFHELQNRERKDSTVYHIIKKNKRFYFFFKSECEFVKSKSIIKSLRTKN